MGNNRLLAKAIGSAAEPCQGKPGALVSLTNRRCPPFASSGGAYPDLSGKYDKSENADKAIEFDSQLILC